MYQPNDTSLGPKNWFLPPANEVCEGYVFTRVCNSVHRGGGVRGCSGRGMHGCSGGVCGCPGVACMVALGGMRGCSRGAACMVALGGWHVWLFGGVCIVAPGGWHVWLLPGGHMVAPGGTCMGYDEIQRYDQ